MQLSLLGTSARYFLEVARTGSVTQAAEQLHVAASAVSRQISKLEDAVGCPLFERRARGMALSEAGERLAAHVRTAALEDQRVLDELKAPARAQAQSIRVACTEGFTPGFMADVLAAFRRRHPDCTLHIVSTTPEGVSGLVARGDAAVGLKFSVAPERNLHIEHQQPAPIRLIVGRAHPLAQQAQVPLRQALQYPLGLPARATTLGQMLDLVFQLEGLHCTPACTGNLPTLLALTALNELVMFSSVLSIAHRQASGEVRALPVPELQFHQRQLQVLTHEQSPPAGLQREFVDTLVQTAMAQG